MLTIARALMGNPDLLVLDEPTEGLSPVIVAELRELIVSLKRMETTILLSEQNIRFALTVTDRVFIIDKGHIVYTGTPILIYLLQPRVSAHNPHPDASGLHWHLSR